MGQLLVKYVLEGDVYWVEELLKGGLDVNTRAPFGATLIQLASVIGNVHLVKLLLRKGADVHILAPQNATTLMYAACCEFDNSSIIHLLIENGVPINAEDDAKNTALHGACGWSVVDTVETLVNCGANIGKKNSVGITPIAFASMRGKLSIVQFLMVKGADVGQRGNDGSTLLMYAASYQSNNAAMIKLLVGKGLCVNDIGGEIRADTAIHIACQASTVDTVNALIESGASVNINDGHDNYPIHLAAKAGNANIVEILIKSGADARQLGGHGYTSLIYAAMYESDNAKVINLLVQAGVPVNAKSQDPLSITSLSLACQKSVPETVRALLDNGANFNIPNSKGDLPLQSATICGKSDIVSLLISRGADTNVLTALGHSLLMIAAMPKLDNSNIINKLVKAGVSVNAVSRDTLAETPLHIACRCSVVETVHALIDNGVCLNMSDGNGNHPIHCAAGAGNVLIMKLLIKNGADVMALGENGHSALMFAANCKSENAEMIKLLVQHGAIVNVSSQNEYKDTALHIACQTTIEENVKALIDCHADVNAMNATNNTPLHKAAKTGAPSIVQLLIKSGANVFAHTVDGCTTLMAAAQCSIDNTAVISQLIRAGLDVNGVGRGDLDWTSLHFAIQMSVTGTVKALIEKKADIHFRDPLGRMPIHIASFEGKYETLCLLINSGADVNAVGQNGYTTLMFAAISSKDNSDTIQYLIHMGISVNALSNMTERSNTQDYPALVFQSNWQLFDKTSALHLSCLVGNIKNVETLVNQGALVNQSNGLGDKPLHMAIYNDNLNVAVLLISKGTNINASGADGVTPLCLAASITSLNMVTLLTSKHADANISDSDGQLPIHRAVGCLNQDIIVILLANTEDLNVQDQTGCTALHLACKFNFPFAEALMQSGKCGVDIPNDLGNTAFHIAAESSQLRIVTMLKSFHCDLNAKNNFGETALFSVCDRLNPIMVDFLADQGCALDVVNNLGNGLLHAVIMSEHHSMVFNILLGTSSQIQLNSLQLGTKRITLLSVSNKIAPGSKYRFVLRCTKRNFVRRITNEVIDISINPLFCTMIDKLLSKHVNIDAKNFNNQTPLHVAASRGFFAAVSYLVYKGADLLARDKFDHIPLMLAFEDKDTFQLLWSLSIEQLSVGDWKELGKLAHYYGNSEVLDECQEMLSKLEPHLLLTDHLPQMLRKQWLKIPVEADLNKYIPIWLTTLQPLTYTNHDKMITTVSQLLKDMEDFVAKDDILMAFEYQRCGSEEEGTKVMMRDEQDVPCILKNIKFDMFEEIKGPDEKLNAFVELISKREFRKLLKKVLDSKHRLSPSKLCKYFYKAISKFLARAETLQNYPNIQRITVKDITERKRRIAALHIRFHDDVYPSLDISIDIVPMLALHEWYPHWSNQHPLTKQIQCVALPKWKLTQEIEMTVMEIGVHKWGPLFRMMPSEMKQGYRLAKVVRDNAICPQIEDWQPASYFMDSYFMKQIIVKEYAALYDKNTEKDTGSLEQQTIEDDIYWARRIYELLEQAFDKQKLETFLFPEYNLLRERHFRQFKNRACHYAQLCRALLTREAAAHFKKAYMGLGDGE